jgi:transposase
MHRPTRLRCWLRSTGVVKGGQVGEILRREGLYSSLIDAWRKQRDRGALEALGGRTPGPKPVVGSGRELARLRERVAVLESRLATATELIEAQGKVSALLQDMSRKSANPN